MAYKFIVTFIRLEVGDKVIPNDDYYDYGDFEGIDFLTVRNISYDGECGDIYFNEVDGCYRPYDFVPHPDTIIRGGQFP